VADFDPSTDPEVIALFATEAAERVLRLTACLDALSGGETGVRDDCRREAHTLKGTAAMMGFAEVAESARRLELLLAEPDVDAIRIELTQLIALVATATTASENE
jgi:chemotaxis protein histidine kinase CheA